MYIAPRPRRQRVYAVVAPATMDWLKEQKERHGVSYGVLIDNLVNHQQKREKSDARS